MSKKEMMKLIDEVLNGNPTVRKLAAKLLLQELRAKLGDKEFNRLAMEMAVTMTFGR